MPTAMLTGARQSGAQTRARTKTRNALGEDTLSGGLHAQDAVSPHMNPTTKHQPLAFFDGIVKLNSYKAREHKLTGGWGL